MTPVEEALKAFMNATGWTVDQAKHYAVCTYCDPLPHTQENGSCGCCGGGYYCDEYHYYDRDAPWAKRYTFRPPAIEGDAS